MLYLNQLDDQHKAETQRVEEAVRHLQHMQRQEAEKAQTLAACQKAKREGLEKLNRLLLQCESNLREQWVGVLQLEEDQQNIKLLRRGADILLLEEQLARNALQRKLHTTSSFLHECLGALNGIDDANLQRIARRLGLPGAWPAAARRKT